MDLVYKQNNKEFKVFSVIDYLYIEHRKVLYIEFKEVKLKIENVSEVTIFE
jgi:hypothetical protein